MNNNGVNNISNGNNIGVSGNTSNTTAVPTTQSVSTVSPENVSEVRTTFSPVAMPTTEQSTTQSEVKPTIQSPQTSPAPDSYEETAPVMGERAFYN